MSTANIQTHPVTCLGNNCIGDGGGLGNNCIGDGGGVGDCITNGSGLECYPLLPACPDICVGARK